MDVGIHKEEIKEYVKDIKTMKINLKKLYSLVYINCTEIVQMMLKDNAEHKQKSRNFNYKWIFSKVKTIVSGLDTRVNLRVLLHDAISNLILFK